MHFFECLRITPASDFKRYSAKANINTKVNRWFNAGLNVTFSHSIQNTTVESSAGASPLYNALSFPNAVPGKHSKKCTFYTLRFGCSFAAVNTIKPQLL